MSGEGGSQWWVSSGIFCRPCSSLSPWKRGQKRLNRGPTPGLLWPPLPQSHPGSSLAPFRGGQMGLPVPGSLPSSGHHPKCIWRQSLGVGWAALTSSNMWIWALIFIESLVRLSLSLEKRNKKGRSGPHDQRMRLPPHSKSYLCPGRLPTAGGRTPTIWPAPMQRCLAIIWAALTQRISELLNPFSTPGGIRYWGDSRKHNKQKLRPHEAQILIERDKSWSKIQSMSDGSTYDEKN